VSAVVTRPGARTTLVARAPEAGARTRHPPTWLAAVTLAGLGIALPLLVADHFGALGIARGDDVAYLSSAFRLFDDGIINGSGWAAMNLVGQLIAALPVIAIAGHSITALQIEVALIGFVGLWAVYDLAGRVLSRASALFVAVLVAVNPIWLQLVSTYLTDVPAFSLAMASLALGARALLSERHRGGLLVASFTVGFAAYTIREFAVVAPISVAVVAIGISGRRRDRLGPLMGLGVLVTVVVAFFAWRRGLPGFITQDIGTPTSATVRRVATRLAQSLVLLGVMVTPALILAGPGRLVRAAWMRARITTAVVISAIAVTALIEAVLGGHDNGFITPDHYISTQWTIEEGYRPLIPSEIAVFLKIVGVIAVAVMLCAVIPAMFDTIAHAGSRHSRATRSPVRALVAVCAAGYVSVYLASSIAGISFFARYVLPLVPLVAILVLAARRVDAGPRRLAMPCAVASLAVLGTVGTIAAAANASLDGAKFAVAQQAARALGSKQLVDGGLEWNNVRIGEIRYSQGHPPPDACARVRFASVPPTGETVVARERVWTVGTDLWLVARQTRPCPDDP
jgi:hypothetical protein